MSSDYREVLKRYKNLPDALRRHLVISASANKLTNTSTGRTIDWTYNVSMYIDLLYERKSILARKYAINAEQQAIDETERILLWRL